MGLRYIAKSSEHSISLKSGFTLVEISLVLAIVAGASAIFIPKLDRALEESKLKSEQKDLLNLNQAVDAYRSMEGTLPTGSNDLAQNEAVIQAIKSGVNGQKLVAGTTIKADKLESSGQGNNFKFVRYGKATAEADSGTRVASATEPTSSAWFDAGNTIPLAEGSTPVGTPTSPNVVFGNEAFLRNLEEMANQRARNNQPIEKAAYFYVAGNHEFIVPPNVKSIKVEAIGGGGSGTQFQHIEEWGAPERITSKLRSSSHEECRTDYNIERITIIASKRTEIKNVTPRWDFGASSHPILRSWCGSFYPSCTCLVLDTNIPKSGQSIELPILIPFTLRLHIWHKERASCCGSSMDIILEKREWNTYDIHGQGGSVGEFKREVINSLNGGETVRIVVGAKGINDSGGTTSVNVNGISIVARGGAKGGQPSVHGQCSNYFGPDGCMHGSGGVGQVCMTDTRATDGVDGMVKITYVD